VGIGGAGKRIERLYLRPSILADNPHAQRHPRGLPISHCWPRIGAMGSLDLNWRAHLAPQNRVKVPITISL